jgi:hypothetical protein
MIDERDAFTFYRDSRYFALHMHFSKVYTTGIEIKRVEFYTGKKCDVLGRTWPKT